ncbi:hypothetical protein Sfum_1386 [Syntrophobacter fumaroxidans MPOB]|uniref:Uncharacterized protein n=1 Tax=Syntrophobacter fumaroxidans (strain DSM 10017 / MPOB) TaxID=335543 RepID=A0LI25_SYNFM|nr:hypothetical protein Sfum_1386 [Syntrophobacter fumaroxidans MPOB]
MQKDVWIHRNMGPHKPFVRQSKAKGNPTPAHPVGQWSTKCRGRPHDEREAEAGYSPASAGNSCRRSAEWDQHVERMAGMPYFFPFPFP